MTNVNPQQPPGTPYGGYTAPQPAPTSQPEQPAQPPKEPGPFTEKRFSWRGLIITAVVALGVGGYLFGDDGDTSPSGTPLATASQASSEPAEEPTDEPTQEPVPTKYTPKKSDWALKVKTTDKQCFGSAGCNVSIKISPQYAGANKAAVPHEGTIDITYNVSGDESGPITGTATVELADGTVDTPEESLSTRSSSTKIKAAVTDVEYNEYG